jgi:hypothetical protein
MKPKPKMNVHPDPIKEGVYNAFADWALNHEASFPHLLKDAIREACQAWLEDHSTQIIAAIAQSHADLSPESACWHQNR